MELGDCTATRLNVGKLPFRVRDFGGKLLAAESIRIKTANRENAEMNRCVPNHLEAGMPHLSGIRCQVHPA